MSITSRSRAVPLRDLSSLKWGCLLGCLEGLCYQLSAICTIHINSGMTIHSSPILQESREIARKKC